MFRTRLHRQIYLTIVASILLVVILSGVVWNLTRGAREDSENFAIAERIATHLLAPADATAAAQAASVDDLSRLLEIDLALFTADGARIGGSLAVAPPRPGADESRWRRGRDGPGWTLRLDDGRLLALDFSRKGPRRTLGDLLLFLLVAAVAVGIGAYPFARRLTRRLERLREGVERIGAGDLSARVEVAGRDEIAGLAASFNRAAAEIERLVDARRMLLAHASHELRTPLARIRMGVEMAGADGDPARLSALAADIAELDALIDEILLTTRLDGANIELARKPIDLLALAAEEAARFQGCRIEAPAGEAPTALWGDPVLLRRMIRNLLANAFAHGGPPVTIAIAPKGDLARSRTNLDQDRSEMAREAEGRQDVSDSDCSENALVRIEVTDHGPGVAQPDRDRIFEPFYRAADRQNVKGYGLGLPLVRQIAAAHGGSTEVGEAPGGGAAFTVTLPRRKRERRDDL